MSANGSLLATFAAGLQTGDPDGNAVAAALYRALAAQQQEAGITDIWWYDFSVEMELGNGEHWAVECLGPNAFRLYPGIVRDESVTWLNLWVAPDYTLDELIERMNEVAASAKGNKNA
jgi:hypothetical protein